MVLLLVKVAAVIVVELIVIVKKPVSTSDISTNSMNES